MEANRLRFRAWDGKKMFTNALEYQFAALERTIVKGAEYDPTIGYTDELAQGWVMIQSLGLVDKNGVEAFVSDIVSSPFLGRHYAPAVITQRDYGYSLETSDDSFFLGDDFYMDELEIIGNIYENPELRVS